VNSFNFIVNPNDLDLSYNDGTLRGYIAGSDSEEAMRGVGVKEFPQELYVPRKDWDDWIRENDKHECWPENYSSRFTNQNPTHECVYHCRTQCFETTYNQIVGMEHCVWTSPLAGYFHDKGPRGQWGGANVNESLNHAMSVGLLPECDGPEWLGGNNGQAKRFKHTMIQTSGTGKPHWESHGWPKALPEGWEQTGRHFRVLEAFWIPNTDAHVSAILRRRAVGNGRSGHSIPHVRIVKDPSGNYLSRYKDSYDVFRHDSLRMTGGGYCINLVTTPDDPLKPAGADMRIAV
jgi:hypothetical protein